MFFPSFNTRMKILPFSSYQKISGLAVCCVYEYHNKISQPTCRIVILGVGGGLGNFLLIPLRKNDTAKKS